MHQLNMVEKQKQSPDKQLWTIGGFFWLLEPGTYLHAPQVPAIDLLVGTDTASLKPFRLRRNEAFRSQEEIPSGWLSAKEQAARWQLGWDPSHVEETVAAEAARLGVVPAGLKVYVGELQEIYP